jgi:GT2 family glycosyltransferase
MLANINRGQVSSAFMMGAITALQQDVIHGMVVVESGPYLDDGRNKAIANALQLPDWEYLLFIDSDIEWQPHHVTTLFNVVTDTYAVMALAGVYVNPFDDGLYEDNVGPVVYTWGPYQGPGAEEGMESFQRLTGEALAALPPVSPRVPDLCKVDAVGTGFLALHRDLLLVMQEKFDPPLIWFHEPVVGGVHFGEDMGFCLRLRDLGYPVLVNRACTPIHHKTMKLI